MLRASTTIAALAVAATAAHADLVTHTDAAAFNSTLRSSLVESLETQRVGEPVAKLDFNAELNIAITSTARTNRVVSQRDGYGAIAHDGDQFWKLAKGQTRFELSHLGGVDSFGFWYSDLESSDLDITFHTTGGDRTFRLSDHNANKTDFVGFNTDDPINAVTVAWTTNHNDGVGFDRLTIGSTFAASIPAPASVGLGLLGAGLAFRRRTLCA